MLKDSILLVVEVKPAGNSVRGGRNDGKTCEQKTNKHRDMRSLNLCLVFGLLKKKEKYHHM